VIRPVGAAVLAALLMAAPAAAQDAQPVVGGGSFNAAPILAPGRYRDTVLPGEYLYYGVRVQPGQALHLTGNVELTREELRRLATTVYLGLESPTRVSVSGTDFDFMFGSDSEGADFTGPKADTVDDDTSGPWTAGGVYYVSVHAFYQSNGDPPKAEIPVHFEVQVEGIAEPRPKATPFPTAAPTATPAPPPATEHGSGAAVAAGLGVGGLLIGVVAGIAMIRRRGA